MESSVDSSEFIIPNSAEEHLKDFDNNNVVYLSIYFNDKVEGFFVLAIENNNDVEFRRIVVNSKGKGIGQAAIKLMEEYCANKFHSKRMWLDVFAFNERGQHIYKKLGYKQFDVSVHNGKQLFLFEKKL